MNASTEILTAKQVKKIERLKALQGKTPTLAYVLNVPLPGVGNILFGRVGTGIVLVIAMVIALFMALAGAASLQLGLVLMIVSVVGALFTAGLSLILLPIGIFLMFFGAGGPVIAFIMYAGGLTVAEFAVYKTAKQVEALSVAAGETGAYTVSNQTSAIS